MKRERFENKNATIFVEEFYKKKIDLLFATFIELIYEKMYNKPNK